MQRPVHQDCKECTSGNIRAKEYETPRGEKKLSKHLCTEDVTLRVSARVCTTPWVAKTRLKVKPMADSRTRMGRSLRCTSQPPKPYRANKEQCTAVLKSSSVLLIASCTC